MVAATTEFVVPRSMPTAFAMLEPPLGSGLGLGRPRDASSERDAGGVSAHRNPSDRPQATDTCSKAPTSACSSSLPRSLGSPRSRSGSAASRSSWPPSGRRTPIAGARRRAVDGAADVDEAIELLASGSAIATFPESLADGLPHPGLVSLPLVDGPTVRTRLVWRAGDDNRDVEHLLARPRGSTSLR